ncbi:MAG: alpha-glucosidase C-terminal domain-containing protein [Opitutales bacterium]|nr:alpha-glucosidase C-terminal domain-containing protein [Opitutales bacterium]
MADFDLTYEAQRSLARIRPKIIARIEASYSLQFSHAELIEAIDSRLDEYWLKFFHLLYRLYGDQYDFFYYLESILLTAVDCWLNRPDELLQLDQRRENDPEWYLSQRMVGGSLYVDLFSGDLNRLRERIPYLRDLGLTYVHLMPLFASRPGNSDGGYAISDYRTVDPRMGSMADLRNLAHDLREVGISLVLDFVFNHTSDDHEWALRAQEGEREFQDYYHVYPDRTIPDLYEKNLREIFPTIRRGNFTWHSGMQKWVWTTFNSFQWDLRYSNPEVFRAMAAEMLFLANTGVEILRLDAVAFVWKRLGTNCENLPQAHLLIKAFSTLCRIAAPSLIFKSEAIVHPDEVVKYISPHECQLSYNPTLMALLWESTATRQTRILRQSLSHRHDLPEGTAWINYLRGHDDIGWSFDNDDAWAVGINPDHHRDFLNRFYTGRFPGSFSSGVPFQHNEDTGDMRISGTMASLAGLEQALEKNDPYLLQMALRRIRMLYGVLASIGGIPLIFLGEEWGTLNNYQYLEDADKAEDSRWVHRSQADWSHLEKASADTPTVPWQVFRTLQSIFSHRQKNPSLWGSKMRLLPIGNDHTLAYLRWVDSNQMVVIANFSDTAHSINLAPLRSEGLSHFLKDDFTGETISTAKQLHLEPYAMYWLNED